MRISPEFIARPILKCADRQVTLWDSLSADSNESGQSKRRVIRPGVQRMLQLLKPVTRVSTNLHQPRRWAWPESRIRRPRSMVTDFESQDRRSFPHTRSERRVLPVAGRKRDASRRSHLELIDAATGRAVAPVNCMPE